MPNGPWKRPADDGEAMVLALEHPLRRDLLKAYGEGVCSPTELAQQFGEELQVVAFHSRTLNFYGAIELVETRPSRGSIQHFYVASELGRRTLDGGQAQPG